MGRYFLCKERGTDMAVKLIRGGDPNLPWEYLGLAADAKPTAGVPAGSTFLEADTAVKSMFNGTAWYPIVERTSIVGSLPKVTIEGSDIAVPFDLQYNNLTNEEALPIKPTAVVGRTVRLVNATSITAVNAGATENIDVSPTPGYQGKVLGLLLSCNAPASAATGNHYFKVLSGTAFSPIRLLSVYNKVVSYDYGEKGADTTASPADAKVLYETVSNLRLTTAMPIRIQYTNGTDVNQTSNRTIYLLIEEELITS